ncbi:unnamed protein product, partial [Urochloa humidicola]
AIDLVDQTGSLANLRHAQHKQSKDVKDLETELSTVSKEKNHAIRSESYRRVGVHPWHDLWRSLQMFTDRDR